MKNEDKKSKKGLLKVISAKKAIGGLITAAALAIGAHFVPFENISNYFGGNTNQNLEQGMENPDNDEKENNDSQQTPTPEETTPSEPEEKETLTPDDDDYYFDEEDEEDYLDEEDATLEEGKQGENNELPAASNDDFKDLVIPNINAYKGKGNSIVDALNFCGYPSDKAYRARLAAFFGIENYQYLADQNLLLLDYLYQYYAYLDNGQDTNTNTNTNTNTDNTNTDNKTENEEHTCSFGEWESLNDEKEIRRCSCGKYEERNHSYGPWIDLGNGKEVRFCRNCGHVHERNKNQEQECDHTLGSWKDNGNGTCSRSCSCGSHKETKSHVQGKFISSRKYVNANNEWIEEKTYSCANCGAHYTTSVKLGNVIVKEIPGDDVNHRLVCIIDGQEVEVGTAAHTYDNNGKCTTCGHEKKKEQECDHTLGPWKDNGDGTCSRSCSCGDNKETKNHVEGELVSTDYIVENDICIECNTYRCAHCNTTFVKKTNHGKVIRVKVDDNTHNLVCEADGRIIASEAHTEENKTITYEANPDDNNTHIKVTTYYCPGCKETIIIRETLSHGAGTWEAIDEQYEHLVDECGHEIARGEHPYNVTTNDDGSKDYSCPNCGQTKHENAPEHTCSFSVVDKDYDRGNDTICYIPILGCDCGIKKDGEPVEHSPKEVRNGLYVHDECEHCGKRLSEDRLVPPTMSQSFDHEVADEDDFDYEVSDADDFDLKEGDIPSTAFLNLTKSDIEYMADRAIARLDLENALNEEMQAKGLTLTYKG